MNDIKDARADEAWAIIPGFKGYWISNHGRVLNAKTGRVLKPACGGHGYLNVTLSDRGRTQNYTIHKLVAEAFVPNPCHYPEVNHIDEDKTNPHHSNLEWVTPQMNVEHSRAKFGIFQSPSGSRVEVFNLHEFARENSLHVGSLSAVLLGKQQHHKGWMKWSGEPRTIRDQRVSCILIKPDGEKVECIGLNAFAKRHGLDQGSLSRLRSGKIKAYKGWTLFSK